MLSLFRAEWIKLTGNRWPTGFLIWSFPISAVAFVGVMVTILTLVPSARDTAGTSNLGLENARWTDQAVSAWQIVNSLFGRLVVLAYTSIVFAGEYHWDTWKNVLPRTERFRLLTVKLLALSALVLLSFTLTSIILSAGMGIMARLAGYDYGPALSGPVLRDFAGDYAREVWLAFTLIIISAGYAALAGMVMRSILGGALTSVVATYAEGLSLLGLLLLVELFDQRRIADLYRLTPSYNIANVRSWVDQGKPELDNVNLLGQALNFADDINFSLVVLGLWVIGLFALTAYLFQRQDIT